MKKYLGLLLIAGCITGCLSSCTGYGAFVSGVTKPMVDRKNAQIRQQQGATYGHTSQAAKPPFAQ